jgi:hypothetical protein
MTVRFGLGTFASKACLDGGITIKVMGPVVIRSKREHYPYITLMIIVLKVEKSIWDRPAKKGKPNIKSTCIKYDVVLNKSMTLTEAFAKLHH